MAEAMMAGRSNRFRAVLGKLKEAGIEAVAIVSRDGILIHADMQAGEDEKASFAAMVAALLGAAETAASELRQGIPRRVVIEAGDGKIIEVGAGPTALLVAVVGPGTQVAKALAEIDKAALEVRSIVRSP